MVATLSETDIIANNLANVNTPGYQKDQIVYRSFSDELISRINDPYSINTSRAEIQERPKIGRVGSGVMVEGSFTIFNQGKVEDTGNPFDLAIEGNGFFAVKTKDGIKFTRNGSFTLNDEGYLVTTEGNPVLGQRYFDEPLSPIRFPRGKEVKIDREGKIWIDKEIINQLAIRDFPKPYQLTKIGRDLLEIAGTGKQARDFTLEQGWLEKPDVSVVKEMVNLIKAFREYEANSKCVITNDQILAKAVNDVGRTVG